MILGSELGVFGRSETEWKTYRAGLDQSKRNILDLKVALFWVSAQTGKGEFNPQNVTSQYDLTDGFSVELAQALIELADVILKKIGVTDEVPGLNTLLSVASSRLVVAGLYAAQKSTINGYVQQLADKVVRYTNKVLNYLDSARDRLDNWTSKVSISDLKAIFSYIIKGGAVPPVPSLGDRGTTDPGLTPEQRALITATGTVFTKLVYPPGAFGVHDPSINKWRVFVRTTAT